MPGVFVTGVTKGGCVAGSACQIFVQQSESFADLAAGSQQAIKMFISGNTATHFVGVKVGDKVDVDAWAWRYNLNGQNETSRSTSTSKAAPSRWARATRSPSPPSSPSSP